MKSVCQKDTHTPLFITTQKPRFEIHPFFHQWMDRRRKMQYRHMYTIQSQKSNSCFSSITWVNLEGHVLSVIDQIQRKYHMPLLVEAKEVSCWKYRADE